MLADDLAHQKLAQLLRQLRTDAGMSGRELARRAFISQARISRAESGKLKLSPPDIEAITRVLQVDAETTAVLLHLAGSPSSVHQSDRSSREVGWKHRQLALSHLERTSKTIRHFLPAMLTGLLQTREYAYASCGTPITGESDPTTAERKLARQAVLADARIEFVFLLMPAALALPFLPADKMTKQYSRLLALSSQPNVTIRVVDDQNSTIREGPLNTFVIYDERVVTAELFSGIITLIEPADITYHHRLFDYFLSVAHTEEQTRELIAKLAGH